MGAAAAAAGSLLVPAPSWAAAGTTAVDPRRDYGGWQGWGASLSRWANVFGQNDTLADIFYTTGWVPYQGRTLPGLGLNVVRYELGACMSQPAYPGGPSMAASPNLSAAQRIEGYWVNGLSKDPADTRSWNWSNDADQRTMLHQACHRGADVFQMFSLSPIWWMCKNRNPGGRIGGLDNLQVSYRRAHAENMAIVAKYARDHWGISFSSVEPFNEPSALWWTGDRNQQGCHFRHSAQLAVVRSLREELSSRGLSDVAVAASDENTYDQATATWDYLTRHNAQDAVGQVNTHGYQYDRGGSAPRVRLYDKVHASGKRLWQSEYGEKYEHGLFLAYNVSRDLHYLHPTAWCYWQPVAANAYQQRLNWGLLKGTFSTSPTQKGGRLGVTDFPPGASPYVTNKYFVLAQYTRHIRPCMRIIDSGDPATVAAYDPTRHRLVLVTVRGGTPQKLTYDLSRFRTAGTVARRWVTDADPNYRIARQYATAPQVALSGKRLTIDFSANSVQTIEIDNVQL
ncbi:glycoside hydrolase [Streptomyces mirabilis]|uniref:glycoside hydrolase n=1 Tax=Streptomyces mirabilis TaxID=68239 RepID=UPI00332F070E